MTDANQQAKRGVITKVVRSYGSAWGKIQVAEAEHEVFFNTASLVAPGDFESLQAGQEVQFDEQPDQITGSHAVNMRVSEASEVGAGTES